MKKLFISFGFLISISLGYTQTANDSIVVNSEYSTSLKKPLILEGFKVLHNDSKFELYVFNKHSYKYFQDLRGVLKDSLGEKFENLIHEFNNTIAKNNYLFNELAKKCKEQESLNKETIDQLNHGLDNLGSTVDQTDRFLGNANITLELAIEQLRLHKKEQFWKKFSNIGTGAAIGLLLGILIAN